MSELSLRAAPRVGPGFRLQWEPAQNCHVLLYPEGMVKLNQSAGEILKRCDGERRMADDRRRARTGVLGAAASKRDVLAFVEIAAKQRWLEWD